MIMETQVLIVENRAKPNNPFHLFAKLKSWHKVVKSNGIEALMWLGKGNIPSLILADADMGVIQGRQFVGYLKANGFFHDIPVVAIGEPHQREDLAAMMQAGADDYLVKPISVELLDARISRLLIHESLAYN